MEKGVGSVDGQLAQVLKRSVLYRGFIVSYFVYIEY